jgi:parvulin-like peptidyl-prolyl isomerase
MKTRIFITLISFSFLFLLINGCGKNEEKSGHFSFNGGGGGDMNFEQQALKMEQEDLAKLDHGGKGYQSETYAKADHDSMKGADFAKIHEGIVTKNDPDEVIAVVNGENILRLELDRILDKIRDKVSKSRLYTVEKRILNDLITQLLLKQFIKKEGIQVDQSRIEDEIKKYRENLKNNPDIKDKSLEILLEDQGGSIEELRVALDISFSIDDYLDKSVTEDELKEYFNKNIGAFNGETVTASHILLDTKNIKDEDKLNEVKEKIEKIKEELAKGADFAKLAEENSDCPSAKNGGELGTFGRNEMVKEFTDAAFATNVNGVSEPVKTQFGYHIIKVMDKQEGKDIKFEEVKEGVKIALYNEKTINLIEELNENADTQILLKETPQLAGSHGGSHGSMGGAHGSMYGSSPHGDMSAVNPHEGMPSGHGGSYGANPHGGKSGVNPHGGMSSEKKVEETFSLTN